MIIGIIGGGASGMAAAIAAAKNDNVQVLLFERQTRLGRKLQATGNGRCNLSNINASLSNYHGEAPEFVVPALKQMDVRSTLNWFRDLGLFTVTELSGKVYPFSDQANSVVDVLRFALDKENITVYTGCEVKKIGTDDTGFQIYCDDQRFFCNKLIIACGGLAGTKLGGSMSGYKLLSKFGHRTTKLRPALVQVRTKWTGIAALKGVRAQCRAEIFNDDHLHSASEGEVQFTEFGISGPVIFEISRDVCAIKGNWICRLDLAPDYSQEELLNSLCRRRNSRLKADELLTGILHNRLGRVITKEAGISGNRNISDLSQAELERVCACIKCFEIELEESLGMDSAQVTAGGVYTRDFNGETMESLLVPGLFACGEVLDIDGDCGGYNLQWAWSSGYCAGSNAGKENQ